MLTVHHLGLSQSERIVWLCEELGLPYDLVRYDRDPATRLAPSEYKALHPLGTAPVIEDGDLRLAESGAIVEYIARRHAGGRLIPTPDDPDFADYLFWYHFANGSLMPAIMMDLSAARLGIVRDPSAPPGPPSRSDRAFAALEQRLGAVPYPAGDRFTAADVMAVFPLTTMRAFAPRDLSPFPAIRAYLARIGARPAYRRAMAKADPGEPLRLD